jgi:non-ribosomal peptide synthase protein (TIGR01720 family)
MEYLSLAHGQRWALSEMMTLDFPGWWCIEYLLKTKTRMNESAMEKAVNYVIHKHESLRVRFSNTGGEWLQEVYPVSEAKAFRSYDLSSESNESGLARLNEICGREKDLFFPESGNLIKVVYFKFPGDQGRIWLYVHHVISDMLSTQVFLRDFMTTYNAILQGKEVLWQTARDYRKMLYLLEGYCQDVLLPSQLNYWISLPWQKAAVISPDYPELFHDVSTMQGAISSGRLVELYMDEVAVIDEELTSGVVRRSGADLESVLIAVFFLAVTGTLEMDWMDMDVINSGRNILPPDYGINVFNLVGFLSVNRAVLLKRPHRADPESDIEDLIDQIKMIPAGGIGYYLIRSFIKNRQRRSSFERLRAHPFIHFNYLGRTDANFDYDIYEIVDEDYGRYGKGYGQVQNNVMECMCWIKEGRLFFKLSYCAAILRMGTIERIKAGMEDILVKWGSIAVEKVIEKIA